VPGNEGEDQIYIPNCIYVSKYIFLIINHITFSFFGVFETGSCYVAQAGLELAVVLPQPPKCTVS
jgi:hypothetical protein